MKKRILLIPPQSLPIPDVGGGAIETLLTNLLDENEIQQRVHLIVVSVSDKTAEKKKYNFSKVYYSDNGIINCGFEKKTKFRYFVLRLTNIIKRLIKKIGINVHNWNTTIYYPDSFYYQCFQIAKKERIDIVISEGDWRIGEYRVFFSDVPKDRIFYHLHSEIKDDLRLRRIIPNSISPSNYVKQQWIKSNDIPGKNIVLYNGIDISKFESSISEKQKHALRKSLGVEARESLVLFCGRLIEGKGIEELLDAFEILAESPIRLLVIGSVNFSKKGDTEFSSRIKSRMNNMESVIYLGYVSNNEIPKYYSISDIQVVPSILQEASGLVAIEGMASGLPLIITDSGGMVEYVTDKCSIKVPIDDELPNNLALKILQLSKNQELRRKMGNAGKERAKEFTKKNYYNSFVDAVLGDKL